MDNPDKATKEKVNMTKDQKTVPKASESNPGATGGETERPKTPSSATTSMREVMDYMTDPKGGTSADKTKITKQWTKVLKNMEKVELNLQTTQQKILEDIYKIRTENVSDSKQVGLVRAVVSRTIEKIKGTQKSLEENRISLDEDLQEVDVDENGLITEDDQNMLRDVLEKQTEELFIRLDCISVALGDGIKTIKDLANTPTKFTED